MNTTKTFDALSFEEKIAHFYDVAKRALPLWGYPDSSALKLLNFTENATFLISCDAMPCMIMRVHRIAYATEHAIKTELRWIMDLKKDTDLSLAAPLAASDGNYVETIETRELNEKRHIVCFSFVEGTAPMDTSDSNEGVGNVISKIDWIPDRITIPLFKVAAVLYDRFARLNKKSPLSVEDRLLYKTVGEISAKLHKQSECWEKPSFYERMEWNYDGTFGEEWNNFYGVSYRSEKWLSKKDIAVLDATVQLIHTRLRMYGKSKERYGMIHSDLRTANLLKNGSEITVLDFDDCGQGWYMYDIAGAVALMEHRPDLDEIVKEIVSGYESIRPLSDSDKEEINTFIMMRRIGMLQSLICRIGCVMGGSGEVAELTPEILAFYAKGTVALAKRYQKKYLSITATATCSEKLYSNERKYAVRHV